MKEACFYQREGKAHGYIRCTLCPHRCTISPGQYGLCRVRRNEGGTLYAAAYDRVVSANIDPVEKKPLYHFLPGSNILSVGTTGCNFRCPFCQNWEISQAGIGDVAAETMTPQAASRLAREYGSVGVAYTYNEPLINYEWVKDTAALVREQGLKNVLVTNGYINPEPWQELLPLIDAANIDVKSFRESFYKNHCGARLEPVLEAVALMVENKKHVEITTLLIPSQNDSVREIEELTDWLAGLDADIPLHFSRYFPQYKMNFEPTDMDVLLRSCAIAKKKLRYVYLGNVNDSAHSVTRCPACGAVLITREGYRANIENLKDGICQQCGKRTNIVQY